MADTTEEKSSEQRMMGEVSQRASTSLDQLILILEISFIFLVTYTLITLFDNAFDRLEFYDPISANYLGERDIGSLRGGQYEAIVRVTIIFNFFLFVFSLLFGMWMRYTRDGWSFSELGFTFNTEGYSFSSLVERGLILGLFAVVLQFVIMTPLVWFKEGDFEKAIVLVQSFAFKEEDSGDVIIFTSDALQAEYYFGFIEMGFIWPLSAGFFFFAYAHNSLRDRFPKGVANVLASLFYVFYLAFFFVIADAGKLQQLVDNPEKFYLNSLFWGQLTVFFLVLYISFSAFAETRSIVLPFLLNFVFNVGLTLFKSYNSLAYEDFSLLMLAPLILSIVILAFWFYSRRSVYSTIKLGIVDLKGFRELPFYKTIGFTTLFIFLSFLVPGILEHVIINENDPEIVSTIVAIYYIVIIVLAIVVLTYDPTEVYDALLMTKDGRPIASHIELFQTNDVLISGFFTALSTVSSEIDSSSSEIKSVSQGDREILIEDGVFTRIVALADKDQNSIRSSISMMHRDFERDNSNQLTDWNGEPIADGDSLVKDAGLLSIKFNIPQQTRWIGTLALTFAPLIIILLGLG